MKITQILMNKPVYLCLSILEISEIIKIVIYEFWYDYVEPKAKLCYMDTDSFIVHVKIEENYKDISKNVDKFDISRYSIS